MKTAKANLWPIEELEAFFKNAKMPDPPIILYPGSSARIVNLEIFVRSHLKTIKAHNGNKTYLPDYERLLRLKQLIENKI
jgi:hypothetical protein